ncbi:UNVERIFIED_CONTAM: hypothetical protein ABID98_001215 [Brevibacillus sp. OAP136]
MKPIYWLGAVPFIGMLGGGMLLNREPPYVFGMPFNLFWIVLWIVLTSAIMAIIYKVDKPSFSEGADE